MPTDKKPTAQVHWDEQGLPYSSHFDDIYFSKDNGIAESRYVFLDANRLEQRWQACSVFTIGETGFGTGLNFLLAWQLWKKRKNKNHAQLHFVSVEKFPLKKNDLIKALQLWPELNELSQQLIHAYPPQPIQGIHRLNFYDDRVSLTLCFDDAAAGFQQLCPITKAGPNVSSTPCAIGSSKPKIDAWFLDGFAPAKNPDMWSNALFSAIQTLSGSGTTFATFTAASAVRKQLLAIGFDCKKIKGFGRKREMLVGDYADTTTAIDANNRTTAPQNKKDTIEIQSTPTHFKDHKQQKINAEPAWHLNAIQSPRKIKHCVVIGGGLAGCHTAFALAQKNIRVTLLEKNNALALEASGNQQGVVYAKLSPHESPLNTFNLTALLFATQFYQAQGYYSKSGDQCGVLHLATSTTLHSQYQQFCESFNESPEFVRWLSAQECETVSGVPSAASALYLPQTGWLVPAKLCAQLVDNEGIQVRFGSCVTQLQHKDNQWQISINEGAEFIHADAVVLANAHAASTIEQSAHLPLKRIRGQVSHIPSFEASTRLRKVICGDGYIAPELNSHHCLGATFNLNDYATQLSTEDHQRNLDKLSGLSPSFKQNTLDPEQLEGKVGFRCTTPDYFPIVGAIADFSEMKKDFGFLRKKANAVIDQHGAYHPHLYANIGHGARGLCYTPLASEILASAIAGQILPISRELYRHLHPGRFIIRDLMRNKI